MFNDQVGQLQKLADLGLGPEVTNHLVTTLANCNQQLTHRGAVRFEGEVTAPNLRVGTWGYALYNWQYESALPSQGGGLPWVWVRRADESGSTPEYDNEVKVYLPIGASRDPNVVAGNVVSYYKTTTGVYVAPGYDDDPVGAVKQLVASRTLQGWGLMDGTVNASSLGGSGFDATDSFLRQYDSVGNVGGTGGSETSSISDHTAAEVAAVIADHTGSTASGGSHAHGGATGSTSLDHAHSLVNDSVFGDGGTPQSGVTEFCTSGSKETDCGLDDDLTHTHSISTESAHTHSLGTISHSGTGGPLTHGGAVSIVPPYLMVATLERLNNSRNILQKGTA